MKLNLGLVGRLLNGRYEFLVCEPTDRMLFSGVSPYLPGQPSEDEEKLYVIRWETLRALAKPPHGAICIGGGTTAKAFLQDQGIQGFIVRPDTPELQLLSEFQEIFSHYAALEVSLLSAICADAPMRKLLNCLAEFFRCGVLLYDNDQDLLEHSDTYIPPESNRCWHETLRSRHNATPIRPRNQVAMRPSRPSDYPQSSYIAQAGETPMFIAGFDSDGSYFASLCFVEVETGFAVEWNWLVDYLCAIMRPVLTTRLNTRQGRRAQLRTSMKSIFLNRHINDIALENIFRNCGWMENDLYRLILVKLPKESSGVTHYQYNYENIFAAFYYDEVAITCDDYIVVVLHNDACDLTEESLTTLEKQLRMDEGVCSIGLKFCGMRKITQQYLFARIPFNMYENDDRIRYYSAIMPKHLLMEVNAVVELDAICHWAAEKVHAYDQENGTNYLYSLETYLLCNRSLNDAANKLYIHKSTMYYRIKCIEKIVQVDLEDPYERVMLLLSCIAIRELRDPNHKPTE